MGLCLVHFLLSLWTMFSYSVDSLNDFDSPTKVRVRTQKCVGFLQTKNRAYFSLASYDAIYRLDAHQRAWIYLRNVVAWR
ncbi:hypothetical protein KIN20_011389 [Parelaphostrongylus tenuis]|uniref:Secreted protein n=1 Tax=Parelaphostrongylus tenuis TaxID=148309 RepID=A0AAD5N050_PARTN|nr:hypothetical protein KIN20_011389 [Parelaphostrongylus tenuis]